MGLDRAGLGRHTGPGAFGNTHGLASESGNNTPPPSPSVSCLPGFEISQIPLIPSNSVRRAHSDGQEGKEMVLDSIASIDVKPPLQYEKCVSYC